MPRRTLRIIVSALAVSAAAWAGAGPAWGQAAAPGASRPDAALDRIGRVDAVEYMRGLLNSDSYDPRDRERALNGAPEIETHWRSSIFDGRRTRATRGTGLRLPDILPQGDSE